jgi:citrate/tricarballylate utilization protein
MSAAFARNSATTALALTAVCGGLLGLGTWAIDPTALWRATGTANFYAVLPHGLLVTLFGLAGGFAMAALWLSLRRYWVDLAGTRGARVRASAWVAALRDGLSLRHLHGGGTDCTTDLDARTPWRRWAHHATSGGFMLCLASTTVAAVYHVAFGWHAPHAYVSLPVVLGTTGGIGLVVGPAALLWQRAARDPALGDPEQRGLDVSFLTLLLVTSITGLALLALRHSAAMGWLLVLHLGAVLAFFAMLPYSKFVHGFYRLLALVWSAHESSLDGSGRH